MTIKSDNPEIRNQQVVLWKFAARNFNDRGIPLQSDKRFADCHELTSK